jgi:2-polyprenyl-6-methoxyphenol hydroxylase-like FAD-dependent oxidoreductase
MTASEAVIVAGAGPVGLTAALLLADAGVPVTVVEKRAQLSAASKASTFHPPTLAILHHLGVLDAVQGLGQVVDRLQYRTAADGVFAEFPLSDLRGETPFPYRLHLEQAQLTSIMLERLAAHPHARVLFATELVDVVAGPRTVEARVRREGREETLAASYLIGADGSRSDVRRSLGIAFDGEDYPDKVLRVMTTDDLGTLLPGIAPVTYLFNHGRSASFLRMPDCWRIILRVPREVDDATALDPDWIFARLADVMPHCRRLPTVVMKDVYGVARRVAASYRAGRVVLIGDSAHITNTRGGMNMNCGLHDAFAVAPAIARALRNGNAADVDAAADERRRVATQLLIPRTDRNVSGGEAWLQQVESMAADPVKRVAHLRASAMLDMTAVPAPVHGHA